MGGVAMKKTFSAIAALAAVVLSAGAGTSWL